MKRKYFLFVSILSTFIFGFIFLLSISVYSLGKSVVFNNPSAFDKAYRIVKIFTGRLPLINKLPLILGNKTYLVVLQNNMELRSTGGFMGSYAIVRFRNNTLNNWQIEDIYVPDGQLEGHIDPPSAIQQAFQQGWWKLRDSNWDIDFNDAAKDILWFFDKGGVTNIDGIIAINLSLVQKWIEIIGSFKLNNYPEEVNTRNFYNLAQYYSETDFFPGSIQKRSYLSSVAEVLWNMTKNTNIIKQFKIVKLFYDQLNQKQILVWFKDESQQKQIIDLGWDGGMGNYDLDYLYIVETNLGANKANCCIKRKIDHEVTVGDDIQEKLIIKISNENKSNNSRPPLIWGGDYVNFMRLVIPKKMQIINIRYNETEYSVTADKATGISPYDDKTYQVEEIGNFKTISLWNPVQALNEGELIITYHTDLPENQDYYSIFVKRQPGIAGFNYNLKINGKLIHDSFLEKDEYFKIKI